MTPLLRSIIAHSLIKINYVILMKLMSITYTATGGQVHPAPRMEQMTSACTAYHPNNLSFRYPRHCVLKLSTQSRYGNKGSGERGE